ELKADALEFADRLAELRAGGRPLTRDLERALGLAAAIGGDQDAGVGQPLAGMIEAPALLAQDVARRHAAIAEAKLIVVVGAVADGARGAAQLEARGADIDQERGDPLARALRRLVNAGDGEEDDEVRAAHAADEVLAAVDDVVVPVFPRPRLDA